MAANRLPLLIGLALVTAAAAAGAVRPTILVSPVRATTAGPAVRLTLSSELAPSWREANVGLLALRTVEGQRRLDASSAGAALEVPLAAPGCALLVANLGRPEDRGFSDSWRRARRSVKAVLCRDGGNAVADLEARREAGAVLMARAGTRDEVRPLANPATTRPGSDLPLRVYADGREAAGVEVVAEGPGGLSSVTRSDAHGFAVVSLPVAGPWRIHFGSGAGRAAELLFDVPDRGREEGR